MADSDKAVARLQLDELLDELQVRIDGVRGTRDRVQGLLEAVLTVGRELDLRQVLHSIVEAAVVLVDAEYGALGVIGEGQRLAQFLTVGVDEREQAEIGPLPEGHGILGELIRHPEPLRLEEISQHPASYGFPPGHPPMHSFLGVPIRVRDEVFGNLYLTQKRAAKEFDVEDEAVLATLAVAAGVAIENARLYEEARSRQRWLEAAAEVTNSLLSGSDEHEVLELITERACAILSADRGSVSLPTAPDGGLRVELVSGAGAERQLGRDVPLHGTLTGAAYRTGETALTDDVDTDPRVTASLLLDSGIGPAVAAPIGTGEGVRGVVLLARVRGKPAFTPEETAPLHTFAGQAALALELAGRRRDAEQVRLYADRDRIARDLHDLAIQRLFATGITLQSATRFVKAKEGQERLARAVDDLDETIKIIRTTIFGLRVHESGPAVRGLRIRVVEALEEAVPTLGFTPSLRVEGLVDTNVEPRLADQALGVLGALLTAVAEAGAGSAGVALMAADGELALTVAVDGERGAAVSLGLDGLAEQVRETGGELAVRPQEGGGARVLWRTPLSVS
ncbi:GAF domain-containing protein [Streptomyces sp. A7024]|uniref:GAF domain-containing protein n=1 Tax=Streptomyces coryli TaxID=1128680 RepID=A0A6G4TXF0_9ACTN|nr:GAF domain-containing protein [Streptomyces coryli]NGN64564.1 GAF domain-containing protein [Streptomyces coryli]